MYLHENKELFREVIETASEVLRQDMAVVEKDYYVTMILMQLSQKSEHVVFKGGTSLSKGYHAISRFSEDIDITFDTHIGEAKRKKLKYEIMKTISEELSMPIGNWTSIESDKDYNYYMFKYESISDFTEDNMLPSVKVETALGSYAFPTETKEIDSYVRQFLVKENQSLIKEYGLDTFMMKLQSLERTFIDKVFALCDYYLEGKSKRYSRHIYDIYKLDSNISKNAEFFQLIKEVREHRSKMSVCPSAMPGVDIPAIINEFVTNNFFKEDYESITNYFVHDYVPYETAINKLAEIANSNMFVE